MAAPTRGRRGAALKVRPPRPGQNVPVMSIPPSAAPSVVWWRAPKAELTVPRWHRIGWGDVTGLPHGWLEIPSRHLRLDQQTIEKALLAELANLYEAPSPAVLPAGLADPAIVSVEAALTVAGHEILDRGLLLTYGVDILAGISAQ